MGLTLLPAPSSPAKLQTEEVRSLLERIAATKNDENLPEVLDHVIEWCWPRGDLFYWTTPLNRFDDILATTVQEYGLERVQTRDFDPKRKKLLVSILRFSRLLIENCTNRKLYNSYDVSAELTPAFSTANNAHRL